MARYSVTLPGFTPSTTNDTKTIVSAAAGATGSILRVYELYFAGEAGASGVVRMGVNRPTTAGVTAATLFTPLPFNPVSPAAGSTHPAGWTTQPVLSATDILNPTLNAFGGIFRWVPPPDSEIVVATNGTTIVNLSFRSRSGTSTLTGHYLFEEF